MVYYRALVEKTVRNKFQFIKCDLSWERPIREFVVSLSPEVLVIDLPHCVSWVWQFNINHFIILRGIASKLNPDFFHLTSLFKRNVHLTEMLISMARKQQIGISWQKLIRHQNYNQRFSIWMGHRYHRYFLLALIIRHLLLRIILTPYIRKTKEKIIHKQTKIRLSSSWYVLFNYSCTIQYLLVMFLHSNRGRFAKAQIDLTWEISRNTPLWLQVCKV